MSGSLNPKILIVDDERDIRELLSEELTDAGYNVTAIDSGADAIVTAAENAFGLIVVDMFMPGLTGIQTIKVLHKVALDMPIIGLTGYPGHGFMGKAAALDITVLNKPVSITELISEVKELLARTSV